MSRDLLVCSAECGISNRKLETAIYDRCRKSYAMSLRLHNS